MANRAKKGVVANREGEGGGVVANRVIEAVNGQPRDTGGRVANRDGEGVVANRWWTGGGDQSCWKARLELTKRDGMGGGCQSYYKGGKGVQPTVNKR